MNSFSRRQKILFVLIPLLVIGLGAGFFYAKNNKTEFAAGGLSLFQKVSQFLPLSTDTKKEIAVVDKLVSELTKKDGVTRTYMVMLQNNYELRPGGGFLGQYAVVKVKDGEVLSQTFEDANLLDQRINAKVTPPYPLTRKMQIKKWKFRDSNFSPDFPTNVEKAEYFYRMAGGHEKFDGVVAINTDVFNHVLDLTGPITPTGYNTTFTGADGALKLEEVVEKAYLGDDVAASAKQNRKAIMKALTAELIGKLTSLNNIPKLAELGLAELRNKNIMIHFTDPNLQAEVESVNWAGKVNQEWTGDYLMFVDANLGALKTDYFVKRRIDYTVDFTGEKPFATAVYIYNNTAPFGDWRTSDYHTYVRAYVPKGSVYKERFMINAVAPGEDLGRTFIGGYVDAEINQGDVTTTLKYELPDTITANDYSLMIQKQSGIGTLPVHIKIITKDKTVEQSADIIHDTTFTFQETEEKK
jgi:hypothetical protein